MEVQEIKLIVDLLIQISRFCIILIGGWFAVNQLRILIEDIKADKKNKNVIFVRKALIGLSSSVVVTMGYLFYGRVVLFDPFALAPSLVWLVIHIFMLVVFVYTIKRVSDINHNK